MIAMTLSEAKIIWNEKPLLSKADQATIGALSGVGAATRAIGKNSIKTQPKGKRSKSGGPPYGHDGRTRYKDWIFYFVDKQSKEMVAGAILLPRKDQTKVPGVLEKGGKSTVLRNREFWWKSSRVEISQQSRPHMAPAMDKAVKKYLPKLLENSIKP